jgi:cytochrome c biogenesis protein CcdA
VYLAPVLFLGFLLGVEHALEADHVAAVASLATRSSSMRSTVKVASFWGIGHALTLFCFGGVLIALGVSLPAAYDRLFELGVGLMLVFLGFDVLRRLRKRQMHLHVHEHGAGIRHVHVHAHEGEAEHAHHDHAQALRPMLVGSMHGLAGSAALILVSLQTMDSGAQALVYLAVFGLGTILGMVLFAIVVFLPLRVSSRQLEWASRGLETAIGLTTLAVGAWISVRVIVS